MNEASDNFISLTSDFAFYVTPPGQQVLTLAGRAGFGHNIGTFPFFHAHTLGQKRNLRGYRSTRFAGRTSFYQSFEMRAKLVNFSTYAAVGKLGLLGFIDNGRVWTDEEQSRSWHQGYGGGVWATFFDVFALAGTYGRSVEDSRFTVKLGFLF
jgi:outer membrane translocation and assembly module TamA